MGRDHNDDRRRALVMGKFKFLYQDDTEDLEATNKFELAVTQNKLLGPVKYIAKDGQDPEVLQIYGKEKEDSEGFSTPDIDIPGVLDLFTVVWSNPFGEIYIDQDIKLFEFKDIQKYAGYNDGPESREFCRFYTSKSARELDGFDSSIFWSTGLLWKHFKTCGVERWDRELKGLVDHYRNWREWAHEVHNIPNNNNNNKLGTTTHKKYSDNAYSGPASTSKSYTRERDTPSTTKSSSSHNDHQRLKPPPASAPVASLTAPGPGQTVMVPLPGPDGNMVHVQLSTIVPQSVPMTQQPRYKYINPQVLVPSVPPPGYKPASGSRGASTWKSQVDEFLHCPKTRSCSPVTSKGDRKRSLSPSDNDDKVTSTPVKKKSSFQPRAKIVAPSPAPEGEVNELDTKPEQRLYRGEVVDWRGKFGFLVCNDLSGKIFLHSKDIITGRKGVEVGSKADFQVLHQDSSVVGAKAVNVTIQK